MSRKHMDWFWIIVGIIFLLVVALVPLPGADVLPTVTPTLTHDHELPPIGAGDPGIMIMHNWRNAPFDNLPTHGSWMYWGWDQVAGDFSVVRDYLAVAAARQEKVAISILFYPDLDMDATPPSVYAKMGWPHGWVATDQNGSGLTVTYPAWNDGQWMGYAEAMVRAFGAEFDGNPWIDSVWIGPCLYGETVTSYSKDGLKYVFGHNPRDWTLRLIDWHVEAFPTTPLYVIATGTAGREEIVAHAVGLDVGIKFNALRGDLPNDHHQIQEGVGLVDAMLPISNTVNTAFEHFYAATPEQTWGAMLKALWLGADIIDLPNGHLEQLAGLDLLWGDTAWDFVHRCMWAEDYGLVVFRETAYPCTPEKWTCGYEGIWERGIKMVGENVIQIGWTNDASGLPSEMNDSIYTAVGYGHIEEGLTATFDVSDNLKYLSNDEQLCIILVGTEGLRLIVAGETMMLDSGPGWQCSVLTIQGGMGWDQEAFMEVSGPGYLHLITAIKSKKGRE